MLHTLILLYKDYHGLNLIKAIKTKLSSQFNIKDDTNKQHKHDLDFLVGIRSQLILTVTQEKQPDV